MAIQRGSTCAVLAVSDLIYRRRADMFIGFLECSLWALFVIWLVNSSTTVPDWKTTQWLCVGAAIFGVGAAINDGCAFGSVARLGTGRLDYILTGLGVWLAYVIAYSLALVTPSEKVAIYGGSSIWIAFIGLPALLLLRSWFRAQSLRSLFRLSFIMAIIGMSGALLTTLDQPWPWTKALQLVGDTNALNIITFALLLLGSIIGGVSLGRFRVQVPSLTDLINRFVGGMLMGVGSIIIPGGNDSFILRGMSSGDGSAFLGYTTMIMGIAATIVLFRRVSSV